VSFLTQVGVRGIISIVESFCSKYDILLNGKKTVWMKLGEKPLTHPISKEKVCRSKQADENFFAGGVPIEKVYKFKFLGMIVTSDNSSKYHIEHRKQIARFGSSDLDKIGLKNSLLDPEMKGMLIQTLIRSKLSYGLENIELSQSSLKSLERFENNIIKSYFNLPRRSYTKPVLEIANVRPLGEAVEARRINMVLQLLSNELTQEILMSDKPHNYSRTLAELGFIQKKEESMIANKNRLASLCLTRIKEIHEKRQRQTKSILAQAIEKLMKHDTRDNNRLIRYMLHAENDFRNVMGIG
jgi:hypothetical protein